MKAVYVAMMAAAGIVMAGQAQADEALAKAKNCMSCHAIDKKLVGPSYKEVAAKYKGDAKAPAMLATKVKAGGKGAWVRFRCPPTTSPKTKPRNWLPGFWLRSKSAPIVQKAGYMPAFVFLGVDRG